jgi:hypothetical protein
MSYSPQKQTQGKQKVVIEKVKTNFTKRGRHLNIPLEAKSYPVYALWFYCSQTLNYLASASFDFERA